MTQTQGERRVEYMPLDQITRAPRNPKGHDSDGIRESISAFGLADLPVLDDRTGRLVSGHGRLDDLTARHDAGETPPDGITTSDDGTWLIPVVRGWSSRSDQEAETYLLYANQSTVKGGWDQNALGQMLSDLADYDERLLTLSGFTNEDLAELLADADDPGPPSGLTDPDDVPDPPADPVSQPGDVWLLGRHRLLCGDALNPDHIDLALHGLGSPGIVYTDPPYGIKAVPKDGGASRANRPGFPGVGVNLYAPVAGDETTETAASSYRLLAATYPTAAHVWWGGNHYAGSAGLPDGSCWLVWDKATGGSDFADAELAWTNHRGAVRMLTHQWSGMFRASERGKRVHPTQKPVALAEWAFGVVDADGSRPVVLDVFAGSGSTVLAAHRTDRTAAVIEIEAAYVDVICRRFQEHTGVVPVLEATGEPHDFTAPEPG